MRIFGLGLPELIIIVLIVCVLFGPVLFKKLNKQVRATGKAAKKSIEGGAKAAGKDVDLDNLGKDGVLEKVESFQDHIDKMFSDDDEAQAKPAAAAEPAAEKTLAAEKKEPEEAPKA